MNKQVIVENGEVKISLGGNLLGFYEFVDIFREHKKELFISLDNHDLAYRYCNYLDKYLDFDECNPLAYAEEEYYIL